LSNRCGLLSLAGTPDVPSKRLVAAIAPIEGCGRREEPKTALKVVIHFRRYRLE